MDDTIKLPTITLPAPFRAAFRALRGWYLERRMASALVELDDAALKDIGIYRCEIPSIARARCTGPEWL